MEARNKLTLLEAAELAILGEYLPHAPGLIGEQLNITDLKLKWHSPIWSTGDYTKFYEMNEEEQCMFLLFLNEMSIEELQ